ncbi:hypothetical protein PSCLAVI8L_180044 [Pseudoclavibacter sp. 8L]|nr:hypothetical protein PSCLAVI8L_180044 [Pseudoclavibacter sp. 8L]
MGLVARRFGPGGARPSRTRFASFSSAASRLRSCERRSEEATVTTPSMRRFPSRSSSIRRLSSVSTRDSLMFQESSTRLSVVLTCCPPGPEDREKRQPSSAAGIVSERDTSKSMRQASHGRRPRAGAVVAAAVSRSRPMRRLRA